MRSGLIIGQVGFGVLAHQTINRSISIFLNPYLIYKLGFFWGGATVLVVSAVVSYVLIRLYDFFRIDWFFVESKKNLGISSTVIRHKRFIRESLIVLGFMSCDPMMTVICFRKGAYAWNGIPSKKILFYFICSVLLCNILPIFLINTLLCIVLKL